MKIMMMTDLEGVAGVVEFESQTYATGTYYEQSKHLLTAEVNAAVEGLLAEQVEDVLVNDGHGSGGIVFQELHPAARLIHGRPTAPRAERVKIWTHADAAVFVGQHAMAGTVDGNLNHTQNSRSVAEYKLNGCPIGEIAQFTLAAGCVGVPVIFLSGDEAACREIEALVPGVTTAAVKRGLGRTSAISLSKERARELIRQRAREAVRKHLAEPVKPVVWDGPFVLEKHFFNTTQADAAMDHPLARRVGETTVRLESDDLLEIVYA